MHSWLGCMGGYFGMWGWTPVFLLVGLGIAFLVIFLIETDNRKPRRVKNKDSLKILEKRFAKGEIDEEEFEKKRRKLSEID